MIRVGVSPAARISAGDAADLEVCLTNTGERACASLIFTIRLPAGIIRLRGRERFEVSRLGSGQAVPLPLRIRADGVGGYKLTSANISYRDHRGQPPRRTGFIVEITVEPERDRLPEPQVTLEMQTAELP